MDSWIKLYDKMLEWQWYTDTIVKSVFIHCLLKANYADKKWQNIIIKRGQFTTSLATLSSELNLTQKQIRVAFEKLKSTNEIRVDVTNKYRIITICKYEDYQQKEEDKHFLRQTEGKQRATTTEYIDSKDNISNNINKNNITPNGDNITKSPTGKDLFEHIKPISKKRTKEVKVDYNEMLIRTYGVKEQHLKDWIIARKKKPITESVIQYLIRESAKVKISVAEAVKICAENSWQGFKAEWVRDRKLAQPQSLDLFGNQSSGLSPQERERKLKEKRERDAQRAKEIHDRELKRDYERIKGIDNE